MVALKTLIFSILVPGTVAGVIPWLLLQQSWGLVFLLPLVIDLNVRRNSP
jgi:hypothetical protein